MSDLIRAIVSGGALAALLDGVCVTGLYSLKSIPAITLWQNVASSLLGEGAFTTGWTGGIIGLLLHCGVAFTAATVFVFTARWFPAILRHDNLSGVAFGLIVFVVMNLVVVPLSRMPKRTVPLSMISMQIVMHIVLVGLPISISSRYFLTK